MNDSTEPRQPVAVLSASLLMCLSNIFSAEQNLGNLYATGTYIDQFHMLWYKARNNG